MAENPPVTDPANPPKKGDGKKIFGLPRQGVIIFAVVFVGAVGWFWIRNRGQSPSADTSGAAGTSATDSGQGTDDSAALSAIEQQLQDLQSEQAASGGGGATGTTGDGTGTTAPGPGTGTTSTGTDKTIGPGAKFQQIDVGGPNATRDLYQIAKAYGLTEKQLVALNPQLKKYVGTKKPIPKKQKITV